MVFSEEVKDGRSPRFDSWSIPKMLNGKTIETEDFGFKIDSIKELPSSGQDEGGYSYYKYYPFDLDITVTKRK